MTYSRTVHVDGDFAHDREPPCARHWPSRASGS